MVGGGGKEEKGERRRIRAGFLSRLFAALIRIQSPEMVSFPPDIPRFAARLEAKPRRWRPCLCLHCLPLI